MIGDLIQIKPEDLPSRRPKPKPFYRRRWVKIIAASIPLLLGAAYIGARIYLQPFIDKAATYDLKQLTVMPESSIVFDRAGREVGRLSQENRTLIPFDQFPMHLLEALIATEDSRFYEHGGVDYYGVARAAVWNTIRMESRQGASTITIQLARGTFRLWERTLDRKLLEACVAKRIENLYTKNQILEMYLNRIHFGSRFSGIEAAAQGYFSKSAKDLTLEESAVIVGLIKNPANYNPITGKKELTVRERNEVYDRMVAVKKMSAEKAAELKTHPLVINPAENLRVSYVQMEIENEVDGILTGLGYEGIGGKGFKIHTTLDAELQKATEESLKKRLAEVEASPDYPKDRQTPAQFKAKVAAIKEAGNPAARSPETAYLQGSALVIDNKTGAVLSMAGGRDFGDSQFNRVLNTPRPPGTAFVPFVYAAAFETSYFPGSRVEDKPMDLSRVMLGGLSGTLGEWGVENLNVAHEAGPISARQALMEGKNNSAARLGLELGTDKVKDFAKRAGLGDVPTDGPMLLGRTETTVRDLALAYTTFPNGGTRPTALSMVTRIEDAAGQVVYNRAADAGKTVKVTDPITAYMVHSCLEDALHMGTGAPAEESYGLKNFPAAVKTGTHLNFKDLWSAGYDSEVTCVVWAGLDRSETIYPYAFANRVTLPIWTDIMNASQASFPGKEFPVPADMQKVELCAMSGQLATPSCVERRPDPNDPETQKFFRSTYEEFIRPGFKIQGYCTFHSDHAEVAVPEDALRLPGIGVGVSVDVEEAVPVQLEAPTVIGDDPYGALAGGPDTLMDPSKPLRAKPVREEGMSLPTAPASNNRSTDLAVPLPERATVP